MLSSSIKHASAVRKASGIVILLFAESSLPDVNIFHKCTKCISRLTMYARTTGHYRCAEHFAVTFADVVQENIIALTSLDYACKLKMRHTCQHRSVKC